MARVPVPDAVQSDILLRSRRRCCLCFWLNGMDEVVKGQIAHLDQNSANSVADNLAFLCLHHHDEYDGSTSVSKGLHISEVKKWRDELYKEMEYRMRSANKKVSAKLELFSFEFVDGDYYRAEFRITNNGEVELRNIAVTIRLPDNVGGNLPEAPPPVANVLGPYGVIPLPRIPHFDARGSFYGTTESRSDAFEQNGRVAVSSPLPVARPILLPSHSSDFPGLCFSFTYHDLGSVIDLEYRLDAEGISPIFGSLQSQVPEQFDQMLG